MIYSVYSGEDKLIFAINILENIGEMSGVAVHPEFTPNKETPEAMVEVEEMIQSGSGQHFKGIAEAFNDLSLLNTAINTLLNYIW